MEQAPVRQSMNGDWRPEGTHVPPSLERLIALRMALHFEIMF